MDNRCRYHTSERAHLDAWAAREAMGSVRMSPNLGPAAPGDRVNAGLRTEPKPADRPLWYGGPPSAPVGGCSPPIMPV
jgi:hypothetical protein